jgi:hypothetical protein
VSDQRDQDAERERRLRQLFAQVRPRPQPPAEHAAEIRQAVLSEWEAVSGRRIFRRRAGLAAAAAAVLAAVVYVGSGPDPGAPLPLVASIERVEGVVTTATGARLALASGLTPGAELVTGEGQAALRLASGGSLRIAAGSRVVLTSGDEVELAAGMLYYDSEDRPAGRQLTVTTELGRIRDIGTQFLARLDESGELLEVGVRDGRVALARAGGSGSAGVGERLVATQQESEIRREPMATFGADWAWVERLAPPFETDGRTVGEFLDWFAAQTGRTVTFADPEAELRAAEVVRGSIDAEPMQKLAAVLVLADLAFAIEGERVVIRRR